MRKFLRISLLVLLGILLLFGGAGLWLGYHSADLIREKMQSAVAVKTHGRYRLQIDSVALNAYTFSAKIMGVHLFRDTTVKEASGISFLDHYDVDVRLARFRLGYFQLFDFLQEGRIEMRRLEFIQPLISIRELSEVPVDTLQPDSGSLKSLVDTTQKDAPTIEVTHLKVEDGAFFFYEAGRRRPLLAVEGLTTASKRFRSNKEVLVATEEFSLDLKQVTAWVDHYLAKMEVGGLHLSRTAMELDTFDFRFVCAKPQVNRLKGFQTDWLAVAVQDLKVAGMDLRELIRDTVLVVDKVSLGNLFVNTYRDQSYGAPNMKPKPFPADMVQAIPIPVLVREIEVQGGEILVEVKAPKMLSAGGLSLKDLKGKLTHLTNMPEHLARDPFMVLQGNMKLNGEGDLQANVRFRLDGKQNYHEVKGSLGNMDFSSLNSFLASQVLLEFKSGEIERFDFAFQADNHHSEGELDLEYGGLKIRKLEDYEGYAEENPHLGALVLLGNLLVRNDYRHNHRDFQKGKIYFERRPDKAVFNYWVKSLLTGVISSLGFGPKDPAAAAEKKRERKQRRKEKQNAKNQ